MLILVNISEEDAEDIRRCLSSGQEIASQFFSSGVCSSLVTSCPKKTYSETTSSIV